MSRAFSNPNLKFNSSEYTERKKGVTIYNNTLRNLCPKPGNKSISGNDKNNGVTVDLDNNFGFMKRSGDIETKSYEQRKNIALGRMLLEKDKFKENHKINNSICNSDEIEGNKIHHENIEVNSLSIYQGSLLKIKGITPTEDNMQICRRTNNLKNIITNSDNNSSSTFITLKDESNFVNNVFKQSKVLNQKNIPILVHRCEM